ncbi:hypothetical protein FA95DRAFT_1553380 [Auriscalpium vulgare]|uniref:Uncharacterized protein n=1 Tax=Auriscalpium vulgare TaxID=40419 RepID=A0ACB8S9B0_9AGAM|nr:hypothetical protein FA95DRAFT_1553380 [Auriscalpium vulgare]
MWPTMERTADSSKRKSHMPMLFDVLPGESAGTAPDEADAVAALLAADAADHGVPQTRAQRMQSEMAALERWLIENEDLHETELHGDEAEEAGLTLALPTPMAVGLDPWAVEDPTPPAQGPAHGFEDDFAAFVSAPSLSITPVQALSTEPSASMHVTDGLQVESPQFLVPSHTGGSVRSLHSTASSLMHDVDPNAGYEALDDHGTFSDDDEELLATAVPRSLDLGLGGGHNAPFDLTDMLGTLQALKDDIAGIEDEERRRAMSARFASDFVFNRMDGVE